MGDFAQSLSFTGRPKLWPYQPKWTSDSKLKQKFARLARFPPHLLEPSCVQVNLDTAHRHLLHVIKVKDYNKSIQKTPEQWAPLLLEPCGWVWMQQVVTDGSMTAHAFINAYSLSGEGKLVSDYKPPQPSIPRECDCCQKICLSVCDCGEAYCSQLCLKRDWKNHKKICAQVYENGFLRSMLNRVEMEDSLSRKQLRQALGMLDENQHVIVDGAKKKKLNGLHGLLISTGSLTPTLKSVCEIILVESMKKYKQGDSIKVELAAIVPFPTEMDSPPPTQVIAVDIHKCGNATCNKRDDVMGDDETPIFKKCSRCKTARYCGIICQRACWQEHKLVCKKK